VATHPNGQLIDLPVPRFSLLPRIPSRSSGGSKLAMSVWSTLLSGHLLCVTLNCNYSFWCPPKNWPAQLIKKFAAQWNCSQILGIWNSGDVGWVAGQLAQSSKNIFSGGGEYILFSYMYVATFN